MGYQRRVHGESTKMAKYVTSLVEKAKIAVDIVNQNGGLKNSVYLLWRTDAIKNGALIGEDKLGNKYYENHRYFVGHSRWVIYNDNVSYDYDGSQVTAEWYGWLHYKTDLPPTLKPPVSYPWIADFTENGSGTAKAYTPYSTTVPKVQAWDPTQRRNRLCYMYINSA